MDKVNIKSNDIIKIGIDVGSTTVKVVVLDKDNNILHNEYKRHLSEVNRAVKEIIEPIFFDGNVTVAITGSAGMGMSEKINIPFVQEVYATQLSVDKFMPDTDVVIELGGEDAKIIFFEGSTEYRMNGSCAGGTGSFIDQMANLLDISVTKLDELSLNHTKLYPIASRCGVFAKSDIQPLLNQGAKKEDLSASIYQSVVEQTIGGLASGREIKGKVVFLGGPLTYCKGLRQRFIETLCLTDENAILHEHSLYFVALGSALYSENSESISFSDFKKSLNNLSVSLQITNTLPPLFEDEDAYDEFVKRHSISDVKEIDIDNYVGDAYLGIDVGSTTTKMVLTDIKNNILYKFYGSNKGNPIDIVKGQLDIIYSKITDKIKIKSSAVVGYGEELIKKAFNVDFGTVETVAHYMAARYFNPDVDFIIDIGGQDIKCFDVADGAINNIMLNEACSSGCGSFIQTYASSLGYSVEEFAKRALSSKAPIELGSRCTVFMNSAIKQAQKDGGTVEDISAGLSYSVVQNAIFKVIRVTDPSTLGKNIVVQGGTFLNDSILRSFEQVLGLEVTRPSISGIMGAFGACLYAKTMAERESSIITKDELSSFSYSTSQEKCKYCANKCSLTINTFDEENCFISGNRCERPNLKGKLRDLPNLYKDKMKYLRNLKSIKSDKKIGMPLALNVYELLPFWQTFFNTLGVEVVTSKPSTRETFKRGQKTIPSDTVCYPAKLAHGHVLELIDMGLTDIFYPCMTYNFDEKKGDNHYNCPVVAYYPELLKANILELNNVNYMIPHFGLHRPKDFKKRAYKYFKKIYGFSKKDVDFATDKAYESYQKYLDYIKIKGEEALDFAKDNDKKVIVVASRPYHIDPEVHHGIDDLLLGYDLVLVTEDSVSHLAKKQELNILNQWTYHSRMFDSSALVCDEEGLELIQLVSFGCGIDAITSDEIKSMLSTKNKIYTQLKIDEVSNLGTIKIRVRSLLAAIKEKELKNA